LTRDNSGSFIVRFEDGSAIESTIAMDLPAPEDPLHAEILRLRQKCRELESTVRKVDQLKPENSEITTLLNQKRKELESTIQEVDRLKSVITSLEYKFSNELAKSAQVVKQLQSVIASLEYKFSRVPPSDRIRPEEEARQKEERDQMMDRVRRQSLGYNKLKEILKNKDKFGFTYDDEDMIRREIIRNRPHGVSADSVVVFSTTDGQ